MRGPVVMERGIVSFVGMGPGDCSLCTGRAADRIARADVVIDEQDHVPASRLIELACEGKRVVRAVVGDVLESPRALGELREVALAGAAVEVVPGVDARAAAAAFAGIVGRVVRVEAADVAGAVSGEPRDAVVSLIVALGSPLQSVIETNAEDAAERARALGDGPILVAFGAADPQLRWFERRPLFGKRVLVTRARGQASATAALLRDYGAEPLVVPTITIHPPADPAPLGRALSVLRAGGYAWVAFTSANGVDRVWETLVASSGDARSFGTARLAAIGPATARALECHGLRADVVAKEFRAEGLTEEILQALAGQRVRVLLARAAKARDALPDALRAAGCAVDVVAAYETHPPPPQEIGALVRELEAGRVDAVTFTSASTVDNLCALLGSDRAVELLTRPRIATIGPLTAQAARARGLRVDVTAGNYTVPDLVHALAESWAG